MFDNLMESKPKKQRTVGQSVVSLLIHGLVIFAAIKATTGAAEEFKEILQDTTLVFLEPPKATPPPEPPPPEEVLVSLNPPPKGFQTVVVPDEIPTEIPPVDVTERFDPRDFTGKGVEGGVAVGVEGGTGPVTGEVFLEAQVDDPLQMLTPGPKRYPPMLAQMGVSGKVTVEYIVDTTGHVEPGTLKVLDRTHPAFEEPTREMLMKSVFKPARVKGVPVRLKARQVIAFTVQ